MRVVDNGIGIPPEYLEPGLRSVFHHQAGGAGVGLGLSLCQRIILANYGTIRIDSEVGKGTTVTIALPTYELRGGRGWRTGLMNEIRDARPEQIATPRADGLHRSPVLTTCWWSKTRT